MSIQFFVDNFLGFQFVKKWSGKPLGEIRESDAGSRLFKAMHGEVPIDSYIDFAFPIDGLFFHPYILPKDKNKILVWLNNMDLQKNNTVDWFLTRCFHPKSIKLKKQTFEIFDKLAILLNNGCSILDFKQIRRSIKSFEEWMDAFRPASYHEIVIYLNLLFSDSLDDLKSYILTEIKKIMFAYDKSRPSLKALLRQPTSEDLTKIVNLALEFDLIDNPVSIFDRKWDSWSLEYKGFKIGSRRKSAEFEFFNRMARKKSIAHMSILREKNQDELIRIRNLYGFLKNQTRLKIHDRSYHAGSAVIWLINLIRGNSNLTEYEALVLARGDKPIYKTKDGDIIRLNSDHLEFFIALQELGLHPYRLTRRQNKEVIGGYTSFTLFGLKELPYFHAIIFVAQKMSWSQSISSVMTMLQNVKHPVLTIWKSIHMKNRKITADNLRKTFCELANKSNLAKEICKFL